MEQLITWTALPNEIAAAADGTTPVLRLSLRVSPRLTPDASETDIPVAAIPGFGDWAALPWAFDVALFHPAGGQQATAVAKLKPVNTLVPELWRKLFCGTPPVVVRSRANNTFAHRPVRSFPAARVLEFIKARYQEVAIRFPNELPSWAWYYGRAGNPTSAGEKPVSFLPLAFEDPQRFENTLAPLLKNRRYVPSDYTGLCTPGSDEATSLDFYQASRFHAPKMAESTKENPKPVLDRPSYDFHQLLALLGDYPPLLRLLGLVFDIEIPLPPTLAAGEYLVRARPAHGLAGAAVHVAPATRCLLDPVRKRFLAKPSGSLVRDRHLDLSGSEFTLAQVDIDGAAIKALNFANTTKTTLSQKPPVFGSPEEAGLPALRSGGLSVLMSDRAASFVKKLDRGGDLDRQLADPAQRDNIEFSAEDIARGYRVDIYDEQKRRWYSLCQRLASYGFHGEALDKKHLPAGLPDEGTVTVAGVGATTVPDDALYLHEALFHWDGWSLAVPRPGKTVQAPGTNPGTNDVGQEPTDLANALGLETRFKVAPGTLPRLRYGRRYRLRARTVDLAGNSRLFEADLDSGGATPLTPYLRFEPVPPPALVAECGYRPGESAARLVVRSWDAHAAAATDETSIRYLLAPRAAIQLAEQHGAIDGPAPDGSASWFATLAASDSARVPEYRLPLPPPDSDDPLFVPDKPVPYLPDPLAEGIAITGLPGNDAPALLTIPFRDDQFWPFAANSTLRLVEGPLGHNWDAATRTLTISLPKAGRATLRLSSMLPHADPEQGDKTLSTLGIWDWIRQAAPTDWHPKLAKLVLEGRHWMVSPFRELTLVHAVQRPLLAPSVATPAPIRCIGETCYKLGGIARFHGASTARVDIRAAWEDIVLEPDSSAGFATRARHAEAFQIKTDDASCDFAMIAHRHELGDTLHRRLSYWVTATSRFREYFENTADPSTEGLTFTTPATSDRPADFALDIPSSARPSAPHIEYIVPTFGWTQERNADGTFGRRSGNSLRVYMSGDWFSSGEGELLGVLIGQGPQVIPGNGLSDAEKDAVEKLAAPIPPTSIERFITRWGIDPIWNGGLTYQTPTVHQFPDTVACGAHLSLAENPAIPVSETPWSITAAGHAVAYDSARKLWYCDIRLDAGPAYYPFVRLALARYQPCSVPGCELSRVVTTDCVQTAPDRLVVIAPQATAPRHFHVTVSGIAPQRSEFVVCPNRVICRVEVCMPGTGTPTWAPLADLLYPLAEMQVTKGTTVWSGDVVLPQPHEAQRYRLVVEEYEFLAHDYGRIVTLPSVQELRMIINRPTASFWPRLVYSDAIEIDHPPAS